MASAVFNPLYSSHPSSSSISPKIVRKPAICASQISCSRTLTVRSLTWVPHLGFTPFSNWNGLRKNGFSISLQSMKLDKRKKCKGKGVFASLFGVGAPEALVIGVVALLVFGPKGLAEVAKNLGKTLRAFQPTIRELQEVSREFKSTLEKEIGLDELQNPVQGNYTSNTVRPPSSEVPPDTLQNSQLTLTPPSTATEDPEATTTAPAATTDDSQATTTDPAATTEDSQATTTGPAVTTEDSQATTTAPSVSLEDSQETTAASAVTMEESQPIVDTTNGSPSVEAYSSEELLKITEQQLKAVASLQQPPSPTPSEEPKSEV